MPSSETISLVTGISSILVSLATFLVGWLSYWRDSGRLDASVSLGFIWGGTPLQHEQRILSIQVVNSGRRPVLLGSFGGDLKFNRLKKIANFIHLPCVDKPTSWLIMNSPLVDAHFRPENRPRLLHEGEAITIALPYADSIELVRQMTKSARLFIFDSTSRKHLVKRRSIKKLRQDFADWENGKE